MRVYSRRGLERGYSRLYIQLAYLLDDAYPLDDVLPDGLYLMGKCCLTEKY